MSEAQDKMWQAWQDAAPAMYDDVYYGGNPLAAAVNKSGHRLVESFFNAGDYFPQVLEVGAGTGQHLSYVRHRYDRYLMTDIRDDMLARAQTLNAGKSGLAYERADATKLPYGDASFDRLIAVYTLEHLPHAHEVLKEWQRVVRPGGNLSVAITMEGSVLRRLGRYITTRNVFARQGLDLDYIMARERINPAYHLISILRQHFPRRRESWYPSRLPLTDLNLVYACSVEV